VKWRVSYLIIAVLLLANVWGQGGSGLRVLSESQNARPMRNVTPIYS
jgi:hypothetical protein